MSQVVRKAIIASSSANKAKRIETAAATWGELKLEISELLTGELDAVVKPGNVTLRDDSSILPEGAFNVYLIPRKNKAGISDTDAQSVGTAIVKAIKDASKQASVEEAQSLKENLVETIYEFFDVVKPETEDEELKSAIAEAKSL